MQREDVPFLYAYRVRWADLDPQDIVFNPNYFVFFDSAANEYLRAIGYSLRSGMANDGADILAVKTEAEFHGSARLDDDLEIGVAVPHIGRTSFQYVFPVWRGDELLVLGRITYVAVGLASRRPIPVPAAFIAAMRNFEKTAQPVEA
ncbi:MAG: acyl-CoA thioesterase [Ferrovibrio sp.]|jgi:acyl-CoA thioester hydrolase